MPAIIVHYFACVGGYVLCRALPSNVSKVTGNSKAGIFRANLLLGMVSPCLWSMPVLTTDQSRGASDRNSVFCHFQFSSYFHSLFMILLYSISRQTSLQCSTSYVG